MSWTWRYEDRNGAPVHGPAHVEFGNKSDAESWLGEEWRNLLEQGVSQVTLIEGERIEYGPMSLAPDDPTESPADEAPGA
jgi:hypothetical protein